MSKTIDKRVVEMDFENSGFEKNIGNSQESLRRFNNALNKTDGGNMNKLGGIAGGVMGKFSALGAIATGALMKIGSQAVVAGQQLIRSLSLDQVTAGFQEYELKINSIKTMLASGRTAEGLPVTLDMVNAKLNELNEYADKTIYSFSDMTSNIGKFTNAGVDLDLAVASIQGISNAAALAGANSWDASRAMYNFAQALSAGYVKLIDWKSIENANMATVDFKQALMDAAVAAGTLEDAGDGMYKVLTGNMSELIAPTKFFNESLQEQWMTTEVLTSTLSMYADETTEIGAKATEAATKVRTFSQLMDTVKEALGSGWAMTFEHLFGDFDEATQLWSGISDAVNDFIQVSSDNRNELIKGWKEMRGRDMLINALGIAWKNLSSILNAVKDAFAAIFPPLEKLDLYNLTMGFRRLVKQLTPSEEALEAITKIFKGLFSALQLGWRAISGVIKGLISGIKAVFNMIPKGDGDGVLGFFSRLGDWFTNLNESAKKAGTFVAVAKAIADAIVWLATKIGEGIKAIKDSKFFTETLTNMFQTIKDWVNNIPGFDKLTGFFERLGEKIGGMKGINTEGLDKIHNKLKAFFTYVGDKLGPVWDFIKDVFDKIKTFFAETWETEGLNGFLKIAGAFAVGGAGYGILDFFKSLAGVGDGVSDIVDGFSGTLDGLRGTLEAYQSKINAEKIKTIAIAIGILAVSLLILTLLPSDKLLNASLAITALFANLGAAMVTLDKSGGGGKKAAANMLLMSAAILVLSTALKQLKDIDPNSMLALTLVIAELVAASRLMGSGGGDMFKAAAGLDAFATGILILAGAAKIFGSMDVDQLKQGLTAISILMGEMLVFSVVMGNFGGNAASLFAAGIAMGIIAVALLELTGVVAILNTMSPDNLIKSLTALAAMMAIMAIGMLAIANPQVLFGAAAMLVIAAALAIFVPSLMLLGSLPVETIGKGLLAIAGIFVVLGVAGSVLAPVLPVILGLGAALILIGAATLAAGAGLMFFGMGLGFIAAGGGAAIAVLILGIKEFLKLIPFAVKQLGLGLMELIRVVISNAPLIGEAVLALLETVLTTLVTAVPMIVETVFTLITALLDALNQHLPDIIQAGFDLLMALLQGIADNIGEVVTKALEIISNFLSGIADGIPDIIQGGVDIITAFMEGLSQAIPDVIDAAFQMVIDIINGIGDSIRENVPLLLQAAKNLWTAFSDGLKTYFKLEEGESIAGFIIQGLINGITNGVSSVVNAAIDLGRRVLSGLKGILGIKSPSTEARDMMENFDKGAAQGIVGLAHLVVDAAKGVGESTLDALRNSLSGVSDALSGEVNLNPVISPVLDLNGIQNGASQLNSMLSGGQSYSLAAAELEGGSLSQPTNAEGMTQQSGDVSIRNEFHLHDVVIREDADIDRLATALYSRQESAMRARGLRPSFST